MKDEYSVYSVICVALLERVISGVWIFFLLKEDFLIRYFCMCVSLFFDGFVLFFRSYLDMFKVIIFSYFFWFVFTIIFIIGIIRISIFCMGYLVVCFYFLFFGGNLLLKFIKSILRYWDWLIVYNVFVIIMKNILLVSGFYYIIYLWFECESK